MIIFRIILTALLLGSATYAMGQRSEAAPMERPPSMRPYEPPRFEPPSFELPNLYEPLPPTPLLLEPMCTKHLECDDRCRAAAGVRFCPDHCKYVACD
jgi:hypothetical protein